MKKWGIAFGIVMFLFAALYAFAYFFVIPKAAEASLPYKWKNVKAGLKKDQYEIYLGKPAAEINKDVWIVKNGNYTFSLAITYGADSLAEHIQSGYTFSNYLFYKKGIIDTEVE